ncbi:MAG TPA: serine/threonine-protein kinase [Gemmatimonadales bacterium]|nr:serine/threonine-protein kinase [Gemmatimonadales bacterium]
MLDDVLALEPDQRAGWLDRLRSEEPELAGRLESLLGCQHGAETGLFVGAGLWTELLGPTPGAGRRVGAYTLERPLGQGGMGTVWLGQRSDGRFDGAAAIKFLNFPLLSPTGRERFRREGTLLARLTHPGIARLIDAGVSDDDQPFLVLEYIDGRHLERYCDEEHLPPDRRLRLFLEVLGAVEHAHANLIIHRDLKPSNILVTREGRTKLLDFGIAKLLNSEGEAAGHATRSESGTRALTPEYAAPEQVAGGPVTVATDIYALGVVLYVLLAGRHPTGAGCRSAAEHLRAIADTEPPRLSAAVPHRLGRLYAGDLDNIVARALKKRPEERYASVGAFAGDIRRYLNHETVSARPDSLHYRAAKFVRRNRVPVVLAALVALALAGGVAGTVVQARRAVRYAARAGRAATAAVDQRNFALRQLSRAEAINELNAFVLADAAPSGKPFMVGDLLARADSIVDRERAETDGNRVEMLVAIGRQYSELEEQETARTVLQRAYDLSIGLHERLPRARAACALGAELGRSGEAASGERLVREGLAQLPDEPQYATGRVFCLLLGSMIAREAGHAESGVQRADSAWQLVARMPLPPAVLTLHALIDRAESYRVANQDRAAESAFQRAFAQLKALGRENTQTAGTLLNDWALTLYDMGRPREAEQLFRRAIRIASPDGRDSLVSPMLLTNLARALMVLDRRPEAITYARNAYARSRKAGDGIVTNQSLLLLHELYRDTGNLAGAERTLAEVEPRLRKALPAGHYVFAVLVSHRAMLALARGNLDSALVLSDRAIAMADSTEGAVFALLLRRRADIDVRLRRDVAALDDIRRAIELTKARIEPRTPSDVLGVEYVILGRALLAAGRRGGAAVAFDSAQSHLQRTLGPDHPKTREAAKLAAGARGADAHPHTADSSRKR